MADGYRNIRAIVELVDRASAPARRIGRAFGAMAAGPRRALMNMKRLADSTGITRVTQRVKSLGQSALATFGHLKRMLAPLAGMAGLASAGGIAGIVNNFASSGDRIGKTARLLGLTVEEYQELVYWADRAGVEQNLFDKSTQKLNLALARAADGDKNLATLFRRLGIDARDANGQVRTAADVLPELADGFERNTNASTKNAMAMALFGEEGIKMITAMEGGAEAMAAQRREARRFGLITEEQARKAEELSDEMTNTGRATNGLWLSIGARLAPSLIPLMRLFQDWIVANRTIISQRVADVVKGIAEAAQAFDWAGFGRQVMSIARGIGSVVDMIGGWRNAIIILVGLLNAQLIVSLITLGGQFAALGVAVLGMSANLSVLAATGIARAAGSLILLLPQLGLITAATWAWTAALLANPITWIVLGIGALVAAGVALYRNWDTVKEKIGQAWDWIAEKGKWLLDKLKPVIDALKFAAKWSPAGIAARAGKALAGAFGDDEEGGSPRQRGPRPSRGADAIRASGRESVDVRGRVTTRVEFVNTPPGTQVRTESEGAAMPEVDVGHAMQGAF